jgi:hypothetical protein
VTTEFSISTQIGSADVNITSGVFEDPLKLCIKALKNNIQPAALAAKSWKNAAAQSTAAKSDFAN